MMLMSAQTSNELLRGFLHPNLGSGIGRMEIFYNVTLVSVTMHIVPITSRRKEHVASLLVDSLRTYYQQNLVYLHMSRLD
jgi:hypothetical protein